MFFKRVTPLKNYPQNGAKIFFVRLKLMTVQAGQQGKPGYLPIIELTCYNLMYCVHSLPLSLSLPPLYTFLNKKILGYEVVLDHVLLYWVTKFRILFLANCTIISFSSVILPPGWPGKIYYFLGWIKL